MTITIELSDEQAVALNSKAAAHGLTLADWLQKLAKDQIEKEEERRQRTAAAAARTLEIQKRVSPDPEGWTIRDYINHGRQ